MDKIYNPKLVEEKWRKIWEEKKIYKFNPESKLNPLFDIYQNKNGIKKKLDSRSLTKLEDKLYGNDRKCEDNKKEKKIFSIDTPPPYLSGKMHLGHSFSYAQQDFIVRYHRMKGEEIFYPFGTDDNGLPTERMVEKTEKVKATKMPRKDFIDLCLNVLKKQRPDFIQDWKNLGMSCDFSIFYSTIDDHCRKISQKSFIDLYKKNRVYQKQAPCFWCPECQTAIAQIDLKDKELETFFSDIIFQLADDKSKTIIISTTRPELLPSCVAIFVNPKNSRHQNIIGKKAITPLFNQEVPILADEKVEMEKGTGIVMCCTFGDQTDIEWYLTHNLPLKISIAKDGRMNENAGKCQGLTIKQAREKIIEDLKKENLIVKQEKIKHIVNVHERCNVEIEILETKQWFVKILDLKEKFLEIGKKIKWHPDYMAVRYENWINGLKWDWCISRQRYFGIPFPVWYCSKCNEIILADEKQLPVDPLESQPKKSCLKCKNNKFFPEKDVLDTWATSSLSPQIAVEFFPEISKKLFPMNLRPQAHDIIGNWLFYTIVKSYLHNNLIPWKNVMISGFVLDPLGEKMSKSKGNVIAPQEIIEKYGADAIRWWAAGGSLGKNLRFSENEIIEGKKLLTKLWNVFRFICHSRENGNPEFFSLDFNFQNLQSTDQWILSKLQKTIKKTTEAFEKYEYNQARQIIYDFFWKDLADNYLELVKYRVYHKSQITNHKSQIAAKYTLQQCLITVLKLFSPIIPFITEEIFSQLQQLAKRSIHLSDWPKVDEKLINDKIEKQGEKILSILSAVRAWKTQKGYSMNKEIEKITIDSSTELTLNKVEGLRTLEQFFPDLKATINAQEISFGKGEIEINGDLKIEIKDVSLI